MADGSLPLRSPGVLAMLRRGLRLRCPRCGDGALYQSAFTMAERCSECGFKFEREQGYFVGAIYVNYAVTIALALGGAWLLDAFIGLTLTQQLTLAIGVAALVPLAFFRHARSLWLALDFLLTRTDERMERRRLRRRPPDRP